MKTFGILLTQENILDNNVSIAILEKLGFIKDPSTQYYKIVFNSPTDITNLILRCLNMIEDFMELWEQPCLSCIECKKNIYSKPLGIKFSSPINHQSIGDWINSFCKCDKRWLSE